MEALFHAIFELFKIAILSSFYAGLITLLVSILGYFRKDTIFYTGSQKPIFLFFGAGFAISAFLCFFMTSFYGNHGLGDTSLLPVSHRKVITEINGREVFIKNEKDGRDFDVNMFNITDDYVYGTTGGGIADKPFFIYDLQTGEVKQYDTTEFNTTLKKRAIQRTPLNHDFAYYYQKYWNGWRFWLLP